MTEGKQPAFPVMHSTGTYTGMTMMEYFAGLAMQGILNGIYSRIDNSWTLEDIANESVLQADALIKALNDKQ